MMKLVIIFCFLATNIIFSEIDFVTLKKYDHQEVPRSYNFIILINQLNESIENQEVLSRVLKKSSFQMINQIFPTIIEEFSDNGYQIILMSYLNRQELFHPTFKDNHILIKYKLRKNKIELMTEENIISNSFKSLDKYVVKQKLRPLCIILHLPPKSIYSLEKQPSLFKQSFNYNRDFSIANLYNEVNKRLYMYPNKFLIYPSFESKTAILIDNY